MKKKLSFLIICTALFNSSCHKERSNSPGFAGAAFINAAPGVGSMGIEPGVLILIDTVIKSTSVIPYMESSGYLPITPGTRSIEVRSSLDSITKFFEAPAETFEPNKAFTYLIYDTLSSANSTLNTVKLTDDLTPPGAGFVHFRFINAAVNSNPLDVVFVRTAPSDSITLVNQAYIGNAPNAATLSPFSGKLPLGIYIIKLKEAGTQTVLVADTIPLSPYSSTFTFYTTGTAAGLPLSIGAVKHFP